jgi:hypothetical protein
MTVGRWPARAPRCDPGLSRLAARCVPGPLLSFGPLARILMKILFPFPFNLNSYLNFENSYLQKL